MYRIPCECGLVYIGETGRNLSKRPKEHKTNCEKPELDKSALAKLTGTPEQGGQEGQPPPLRFSRRGKGGKGALSVYNCKFNNLLLI